MASQRHNNSPQEVHSTTSDLDHDHQDDSTAVAETITIQNTSTTMSTSIPCSGMIKASDIMENKPSPVRDVTAVAESLLEVATETSKEGRSEEVELDNATMDVPADNEVTIASRIAYNTGHGDFAFGRMIDRRRISDLDEGEYSMQGMSQGSHGNIVEELDGFKRLGEFPFFKLPHDVRREIFKLMIDPFYEGCLGPDHHHIVVYLSSVFKPDASELVESVRDEFDAHLEQLKRWSWHERDEVVPMSPAKYEAQRIEFYRRREIDNHCKKPHPHRHPSYKINSFVHKHPSVCKWLHDNTDYLFLEWIRTTSNVSPQFRRELGEVFWTKVSLTYNGDDTDMWRIPALLGDRPAVCKGIKSLHMKLAVETMDNSDMDPSNSRPFREYGGNFTAWCVYISAHLDLECLEFLITVQEDQLDFVAKGEYQYACLKACRQIRVAVDFQISLCVFASYRNGTEDEKERDDRTEGLEEKYTPMIRQLMLPDTLRKQPTEESMYLDSRPISRHLQLEASPAPAQQQCVVI